MIIEDEMKVRRRKTKAVSRKTGQEKEYEMYFVVFSIKLNGILKSVKELRNVEIITEKKRYFLEKATVYKYSDHKRKNGERVPLYAMVIPKKKVAKELISMGIKKVKIIAEVPENGVQNAPVMTPGTVSNTSTNVPDNTVVAQTT
jgi:hypothetical protein